MSKLSIRSLAPALAGILIAIGGCAEAPSAPPAVAELRLLLAPPAPAFLRAATATSATIGAEGGSLSTADGHKLVFPAGALAEPTTITLQSNPTHVGVIVEPHGLVFPAGREPILTLDPGGADLSGIGRAAVVYTSDADQILEVLSTEVLGGGKVRARLPHFSKWTYAGG
ncbi:MAG TPA: hypothetical protein VEW03_15165 [Longimicrobiaceae bacterium]|nr:hypothetical protein [Longimicrobiaceae bacterium]